MTTKHRLPSWLANRKRGVKSFPRTQSFRDSAPFRRGQAGAAQTGRGNGLPGPGGQVLNTAKRIVEPDGHPTPTSQLATTVADYPPRSHSLSDSETANQLGTFLTNWKLLTSDKWTLQAVTGYKIPFLRTPRQWRPRPTVTKAGQQSELMRESIQSYLQGSNHSSGSSSSAIYLDGFPGGERSGNRGVLPCDQPKGPGQLPPQGEIQDGGTPHCSLPTPQRQLHDETRPEGRLLCCTDSSGLQEIPSLSVRRNNIRVPLPSVWSVTGPPGFYQDFASCSQTALRGSANSHLLGRPAVDSSSEGNINGDILLCTEAAVQPGFCGQAREVFTSPHPSAHFPRCSIGYQSDVFGSARGADRSHSDSMSADTRDWVNYTGGAGRFTGPHESCSQDRSVGGPSSLQSLTTSAGLSTPPGRVEAEDAHISESTISGGPCMVVVSNPSLSQQAGHHPTPLRPYSQDGCILTRLGCNLQGQHNRGTLECGRTGAAHQLLGTQSGVSCVEIIPGSRGPSSNSLLGPAPSTSYSAGNGQHDSSCLCEQERENAVPHTLSPNLGPVVFSSGKGLMDHSQSPTRHVECRSRCSLEGVQCAYRMDASEGCFQAHNASLLSSTDRPLCISPKPPGAPLRVPPLRSGGISSGRFSSGLESMEEFHPSTSGTTASHSSESEGRKAVLVAPDWPGQPWYAQIQLMLMGAPYRLPKERTLLSLPFDPEAIHPLWRSLNLTVWPISGKPTRRPVFPRK